LLSSVGTIAVLILERPLLFLILLAITIAFAFWLREEVVQSRKLERIEARPEASLSRASEKKWIDHAYCNGTGSITAYYDGSSHQIETCGICQGHGQILTDLWDHPSCRRCGGSGKLTDTEYVPTIRQVGYAVVQHHQFNKTTKPCDVCGGTGRKPRLPEHLK
jgi:DnaJ-class molecular chaperone